MAEPQPPQQPVRPRPRHPWWRIVAWSVGIVLVVSGLAAIAAWIFLVSAFNSYGSNK